ncbi:MAG: hypothetical protein ACP5I1_11260, partial [Candidatus Hinthialibacter sp.]
HVAFSGVGRLRMANMLDEISSEPVRCWVSVGFAGGLAAHLSSGDCLIGHNVMTDDGETFAFDDFWEGKKSFLVSSDWLYCSRQAIISAEQKTRLRQTTGASLVDMESAAVAEHARMRREPFVWIRGVSDAAGDDVPPEIMQCFSHTGFPSTLSALKILLAQPALLPAFLKLARRGRLCASNLPDVVLPWLKNSTKCRLFKSLDKIGEFPVAARKNAVPNDKDARRKQSEDHPR